MQKRFSKERNKKPSSTNPEPLNLRSIRERRERLEAMIQSRRLPPLNSRTNSRGSGSSGSSGGGKSSSPMSLSPHWKEKEKEKPIDRQPTPQPNLSNVRLTPMPSRGSVHDRLLPDIQQRRESKEENDDEELSQQRSEEMQQQMTLEMQQLMLQQMQMMNHLMQKQKEHQERKRRKQEKLQQLQMQQRAREEREKAEESARAEKENEDDQKEKNDDNNQAVNEEQTGEEMDGKEQQDEGGGGGDNEKETEEEKKEGEEEKKEGEEEKKEGEEEGDEDGEEDISDEVDDLVAGLRSRDIKKQLRCAERARELLSLPQAPVVQLIQAGALPPLVACMERGDSPELQVEAAWAITNVASGSSAHTRAVVDAEAVRVLVRLLSSADRGVQEQAVWALGNIVGDGAECRDHVIREGAISPLVNLIQPNMPVAMRRQVCWMLTNLFRVKKARVSPVEQHECVQGLKTLIASLDTQVQADALWGTAYLAELGSSALDDLTNAGVVRDMVERLYSEKERVVIAALRATGSVAAGTDEQTEALVQAGALPIYRELLSHHNPGIARESAWILSNITAGTTRQIQLAIDVQVVPALIAAIEKDDGELRKEATWALSNLASRSNEEQVGMLIKSGLLPCLSRLLQQTSADPGMTLVVLDTLNNILKKTGTDTNGVVKTVEGQGGKDALTTLKTNKESQVAKMATYLLEAYFDQDNQEKQ
ncbi:hypothetical protein Pmani_009786 [Petrolisthes manimaculis]|uniref:Importin subunit alpha n=1 Tax=Petrolisthes manimaculis TaxID=1843537 RepID=A0AAE1UDA9_9EUCA|nr:hypothetical protein Pmani_009786 [Petrolisthes manimaculis]